MTASLAGIYTAKGNAVHLYDTEGARTHTLCGRPIGTNPRYLDTQDRAIRLARGARAEDATCRVCLKEAAAL